MLRKIKFLLLMIFPILISSCMVPLSLDEETPQSKTAPRFIRYECDPLFKKDLTIDSNDIFDIEIVIEDLDIDDDIQFIIFKDYYKAVGINEAAAKIAYGKITPDHRFPEMGKYVRRKIVSFTHKELCSSEDGDSALDEHLIEVVVADSFIFDPNVEPKERASEGLNDVWSFVVVCLSSN
jgi:hypothetical protein